MILLVYQSKTGLLFRNLFTETNCFFIPPIEQLPLQACLEQDGGWDLSLKDPFQFVPVSPAFFIPWCLLKPVEYVGSGDTSKLK